MNAYLEKRKHIRVEVREAGRLLCWSEFPAPADMTDEEAVIWAEQQTEVRTVMGLEWSLRVIPTDRYEIAPSPPDWPASA